MCNHLINEMLLLSFFEELKISQGYFGISMLTQNSSVNRTDDVTTIREIMKSYSLSRLSMVRFDFTKIYAKLWSRKRLK